MIKRWLDKRGMAIEELGKWLIAGAVLILIVGVIIVWTGAGEGVIDKIKNVLRFGRA